MDSVDRLDGGPYDENPQDGMGVLSPDLIYLADYIHYLPEMSMSAACMDTSL